MHQTVFPYQTTTYYVEAKDPYNCIASDTIRIKVDTCSTNLFVPGAFTSNNDGKNDLFKPIIKGVLLKYQFSVYNRWEQLIFSTDKISSRWNGEISNKKQMAGVYIWICSYQFFNDAPEQSKGTVLLLIR